MDERDQAVEDILGQTAWIRGLARRLVRDVAERDDVVQEVWIETLQKGRRARALRPWLFGVVRNVARTELRRDSRRRAREAAADAATDSPRPDELVERVELEREVASALLEIAEPYRSMLLLRYYQDLSPTEIARRLKIPAGTVRWRLQEGDRRRWALALIPTAARQTCAPPMGPPAASLTCSNGCASTSTRASAAWPKSADSQPPRRIPPTVARTTLPSPLRAAAQRRHGLGRGRARHHARADEEGALTLRPLGAVVREPAEHFGDQRLRDDRLG